MKMLKFAIYAAKNIKNLESIFQSVQCVVKAAPKIQTLNGL